MFALKLLFYWLSTKEHRAYLCYSWR